MKARQDFDAEAREVQRECKVLITSAQFDIHVVSKANETGFNDSRKVLEDRDYWKSARRTVRFGKLTPPK